MIDIRHLINFLPFYFKDKDTYKVEGKGILERFLEICGDYFTDNIKSKIDSHLDIIDIDTTSHQYLVWLWDLLGQIPFANNKPRSGPLMLSSQQQRDLIRYCNELLKIRGSQEFFEVMFRVYSNSTNQLKLVSIECEDFGWDQDPSDSREFIEKRTGTSETKGYQRDKNVLWPYHDHDYMDDSIIRFDEYYSMKQCIKAKFNITGTFSNVESAQKTIEAFIRRYVPYNVNPIIIINGQELSEKYTLVLEIYQKGNWVVPEDTIILTNNQVIKARVYTVNPAKDIIEGIKFTSSINGGSTINRTSIYTFDISNVIQDTDTYTFTLGDESLNLKVTKEAEKAISYFISISPDHVDFSSTVKEAKCTVTAYSQQNGKQSGALVLCQETGEVKDPGTGTTTEWTFTKAGEYTFITVGHSSSQVKFKVNYWKRSYTVKLAKATLEGNEWVPGNFVKELILTGYSVYNLKYFIRVESDDPDVPKDLLTCYMEGVPAKVYPTGQLLTPLGFDSYIFTPTNSGPDNEEAILSVVSSNLNFLTSIVDRKNFGTGSSVDELNNNVSKVSATVRSIPKNIASQLVTSKGLNYTVELPNGTLVRVPKGTTQSGTGYSITSKPGISYVDNIPSYNELEIQVTQSGEYVIWVDAYPISKAKWVVSDRRFTEEKPEGVIIIPISDEERWTGGNTPDATYQLGEDHKEANFKISAFKTENGEKVLIGAPISILGSNGKSYELDTDYTETEVQDLTFTATLDNKFKDGSTSKKATLHIRDFVTEVILKCTPSASLLINEQATTKLSISCNKPELKLGIRYEGTQDEYKDGDTFIANEPGNYVFTALVNGEPFRDQEGNEITCTFKVVDKSAIEVNPTTIEFEANGTPVTTNVINIVTGDDTEWILIQQ